MQVEILLVDSDAHQYAAGTLELRDGKSVAVPRTTDEATRSASPRSRPNPSW
jgi:hypothetical protein